MNKYLLATIAIGLLGTSVSMPVYAQDGARKNGRTVTVDFSDLDVADSQDLQSLRSRIDTAVRKVCPARIEGPVKMYRLCRQASWEDAERQLAEIKASVMIGELASNNLSVTIASPKRSRN